MAEPAARRSGCPSCPSAQPGRVLPGVRPDPPAGRSGRHARCSGWDRFFDGPRKPQRAGPGPASRHRGRLRNQPLGARRERYADRVRPPRAGRGDARRQCASSSASSAHSQPSGIGASRRASPPASKQSHPPASCGGRTPRGRARTRRSGPRRRSPTTSGAAPVPTAARRSCPDRRSPAVGLTSNTVHAVPPASVKLRTATARDPRRCRPRSPPPPPAPLPPPPPRFPGSRVRAHRVACGLADWRSERSREERRRGESPALPGV